MIALEKPVLDKIRREIGPVAPGIDRLAFDAKVWRAVTAHVPGLPADEAVALAARISRAMLAGAARPRLRPEPREAA
jgi:hypothetical protein